MSSRIQTLPRFVAEKIAAGEMIERPASVVKELVENSLDASSTRIEVALEEGGRELIQVTDNGIGMNDEDLLACVERHATSKLQSIEDLNSLHTLGFRGEALPSIGAVSDLRILSRTKDSETCFEISQIEDKKEIQTVTFGRFNHSKSGTRVIVRSLFSKIPARLKFLKSKGSEAAAVRDCLERLALAYPHVSFTLLSNGKTLLDLPAENSIDPASSVTFLPEDFKSRVQSVLTSERDFPIVYQASEKNGLHDVGIQIHLFWAQGLSVPSSKKIFQVINQRPVRDRLIQQACLSAFRQLFLPGQFPALAVFFEVNPAAIDVNVHPTKSEVRFLNSSKIFHLVETTARKLHEKSGGSRYVAGNFAPQKPRDFFQNSFQTPSSVFPSFASSTSLTLSEPSATQSAVQPFDPDEFTDNSETQKTTSTPIVSQFLPLSELRFVGSCFNTYFLFEYSDQLIVIDQHAAHERVRYEQLHKGILSSDSEPASQTLLIPEAISLVSYDPEILVLSSKRLQQLSRLGFECEIFGEKSLLFRAVPAAWGTFDLKVRLKSLLERVYEYDLRQKEGDPNQEQNKEEVFPDTPFFDEALFESIASEACHSSVRAGDSLSRLELEALYQDLIRCKHPWNCPHGRPTIVTLPKRRFEEWFQRLVHQ